MMVSPPGFELRAAPAIADDVRGDPDWHDRLTRIVEHVRECSPVGSQPPPVCWEIVRALPAHAGLGSATQLGLAVAQALALFAGQPNVPIVELARRSGRGKRSAVGTHGFAHGGLLVEGGKLNGDEISPLVARVALPRQWRFVLIRPRDACGLFGADELHGFSCLPQMPTATTDRLCRLALLELIPSAVEVDFGRFGEALYEYGRLVGEYFLPVQGGVYSDPRMRELAPRLRARGIRGIGQSSWGPTLFALCQGADAARSLVADLSSDRSCTNCELTIAEPLNRGATVDVID
jgi:beta-RFAP synthase